MRQANPAALGLSPSALVSAVLGLWVGQLASAPCAHPPEVSGVDPHSANLGTRDGASGGLQGCLSRIHSPGADGGGVPEAAAAAESSLISCWVPLIFFFFLRNSSNSSPPGPNMYLAAHTAQPGSLPRILQQTLRLGGGFSRPGPVQVLGTLLSLSTVLTVRSFIVLYLWSTIFIYAGISLTVCSAPQIS